MCLNKCFCGVVLVTTTALSLFSSIVVAEIKDDWRPNFAHFQFLATPKDTVAVRDKSAVLDCSVRSAVNSSQLRISWYKDGRLLDLDKDPRRSLLQNGSLYIHKVVHAKSRKLDEGDYHCVASLGLLKLTSTVGRLRIAYISRTFSEVPTNTLAYLGDTVQFSCSIDSLPRSRIVWLKNDKPYVATNARTLQNGRVLEISPVRFEDFDSRFRCQANHIERQPLSSAGLLRQNDNIAGAKPLPPKIIISPQDTTAIQGEIVVLRCVANGRDTKLGLPSISWLKDGRSINIDSGSIGAKFQRVGYGNLQISDVQPDDAAAYTCRPSNSIDTVDSTATVSVSVKPFVVKGNVDTTVSTGTDVTIPCNIGPNPSSTSGLTSSPLDITWLKNGEPIVSSDYFQISAGGLSLRVLGVLPSDAGMYQCIASNEFGSAQNSLQLAVRPAAVESNANAAAGQIPPFSL